jgi:hypothetical protein
MKTACRLILLITLLAAMPSCTDPTGTTESTYSWSFINKSSWALTVGPNGQNWSAFVLFPGDSRTVTRNESSIYFLWWSDHGKKITETQSDETNTFFFWDK